MYLLLDHRNRDAHLSTWADIPNRHSNYSNRFQGWELLSSSLPSTSGLRAFAYLNRTNRQLVICFAAANGSTTTGNPSAASTAIASGQWHPDLQDAADFTFRVLALRQSFVHTAQSPRCHVLVTGQGLGGAVAQLMAEMFKLGGASFSAPGAAAVARSEGFQAARYKFWGAISFHPLQPFNNYDARTAGAPPSQPTHLGTVKAPADLLDPESVFLAAGYLSAMTDITLLEMLGLSSFAITEATSARDGMQQAMHISTDLMEALIDNRLLVRCMPLAVALNQTQVAGTPSPLVMALMNPQQEITAILQREGAAWTLSRPDQAILFTMTPATVAGAAPTVTIRDRSQPGSTTTLELSAGNIRLQQDSNNDGVADHDISSGATQDDLFNADRQMRNLRSRKQISTAVWNCYTNWSSGLLFQGGTLPARVPVSLPVQLPAADVYHHSEDDRLFRGQNVNAARKAITISMLMQRTPTYATFLTNDMAKYDRNADNLLSVEEVRYFSMLGWLYYNDDDTIRTRYVVQSSLASMTRWMEQAMLPGLRICDPTVLASIEANKPNPSDSSGMTIAHCNYTLKQKVRDLMLGEGGNYNGTGNQLNNVIFGNSLNNVLNGLDGADAMMGDRGDDIYYVDNVADQTVEYANQGNDSVRTRISHTLAAHVENLELLDFSKPEAGLVDSVPVLIYGYPKTVELDYKQGDAMFFYDSTCALTSIANTFTQAGRPMTEYDVLTTAIDRRWCIIAPYSNPLRGAATAAEVQKLMTHFGMRNKRVDKYDEQGIANLVKGGRAVMVAVDLNRLRPETDYLSTRINHMVCVVGVACDATTGAIRGFYVADTARGNKDDAMLYVSAEKLKYCADLQYALTIYSTEPVKLWDEDIDATGNELDNVLIGNRGKNTLTGKAGNDTLAGGGDGDTYRYALGDGWDTVIEDDATAGTIDEHEFTDIGLDKLWFRRDGQDLQIAVIGSDGGVTYKSWYEAGTSGTDHQIECIKTADGRTVRNSEVDMLVQAMAGFAPPPPSQVNWAQDQTRQILDLLTASRAVPAQSQASALA